MSAAVGGAGVDHARQADLYPAALRHRQRQVGNRDLKVTEEIAYATPFGSLLHFKKEEVPEQPRLLLVAPMSGHFATLLRGT